MLSVYFEQLIDLIHSQGGGIVKFAGDAVLALWPAENEALSQVTRRAAQCALATQAKLHNYEATAEYRLSLRIGIAAGDVNTFEVGGVIERWDTVVAGAPFVQVGLAEHLALPGQVVIWQRLKLSWARFRQRCIIMKAASTK